MRFFRNPIAEDPEATPTARKVVRLLVIANFALSFGFTAWSALFNNFAVDVLHAGADQVGLIQSVREIPGLLGFVLGWVVMLIPEMRLTGICVALMGVGLLMNGTANSVTMLMMASLVMSVGFHFFDSNNSSLILTFTSKRHGPKVLGSLASISAVAAVAGSLAVMVFKQPLGYRSTIYLIGTLTLLGGLLVLVLGRESGKQKIERKMVFRKRYWLYYILTFLMGSRRHIFTTFAILLLVTEHKANVQQVSLLVLVNSLITTYSYRKIGQSVARFGERKVLSLNFALLALIFVGYAYINWVPILVVFFVGDNILFGYSLALNTYFQKIAATQEEITSNVSMGQTINHLSAVFVPALGGLLWRQYGYQATFLAGTVIVLAGLVLTQWVRTVPSSAMERAGAPVAASAGPVV